MPNGRLKSTITSQKKSASITKEKIQTSNSKLRTIEWQKLVKYLGIQFDKKLNVILYRKETKKKTLQIFKFLYPLLNRNSKMSMENKTKIFKMVIKRKITYGITTWTISFPNNIMDLQRQLNYYARCCTNAE